MATTIRFQLRGDSAENWESKNPVLLKNEPGYDTTNRRLKLGNGVTAWNDLEYVAPDVINDLLTGGADSALSAEQGRVLRELVDTKADSCKKILFLSSTNTYCNLNDSKEPTGTTRSMVIPDGVNKIYISGCGAGGGLGISRAFNTYIKGSNGGYCSQAEVDVKAGDILTLRIGLGGDGESIKKNGSKFEFFGECSRGQDSVVMLNNEEIIRLGGGCGGKQALISGNQNGDTIISSKAVKNIAVLDWGNPYHDTLEFPSYIWNEDNNSWEGAAAYDYEREPYIHALPSFTAPFYPFGTGGHLGSTNGLTVRKAIPLFRKDMLVPHSFCGTNGIIIVEYGMSFIYANGSIVKP